MDDFTRPQDRLDVAALLKVASHDDLGTAADALVMIRQRGCDQGRD